MKKMVATSLGVSLVSLPGLVRRGRQRLRRPDDAGVEAFAISHLTSWQPSPTRSAQVRGDGGGRDPRQPSEPSKHARDVAALGGMIPEGFIPNSAVEGSAALPEVWTNMPISNRRPPDFQNAAQALATPRGEASKLRRAWCRPSARACGGCHRPYRAGRKEGSNETIAWTAALGRRSRFWGEAITAACPCAETRRDRRSTP